MGTSKKTTTKTASEPKVVKTTPKIANIAVEAPQVTQEPESYIVQNITQGYVCVSDLNLTFGPTEVQDLSHLPVEKVKGSTDLRITLRKGLLRRISMADYDRIIDKQLMREQEAAAQAREQRRRAMVQVDEDIEFDAEVVDLNSANVGHQNEAVSTSGYANDPTTYAMAYAAAAADAARRGQILDPEDFATIVSKNPGILNRYLSVSSNNGIVSGDTRRGRATVITPPSEYGGGTSVAQLEMTNFNRDHMLAGSTNEGLTFLDGTGAVAEEIDLALDDMQNISRK